MKTPENLSPREREDNGPPLDITNDLLLKQRSKIIKMEKKFALMANEIDTLKREIKDMKLEMRVADDERNYLRAQLDWLLSDALQ